MKKKTYNSIVYKLIVLGDTAVGKTNIVYQFTSQTFKESYIATIGVDYKVKDVSIDDTPVKLQIWDTAGQERYRTITETYYNGAAGILLIFDIARKESFENIGYHVSMQKSGWHRSAKRHPKMCRKF